MMYVRVRWSAFSFDEKKTRITGELESLIPARMINNSTREEIVQCVCESHFDHQIWSQEFDEKETDVMISVNISYPTQAVGDYVVVLVKAINAVVRPHEKR